MKRVAVKLLIVVMLAASPLIGYNRYKASDSKVRSYVVKLNGRGQCSGQQIEAPSGKTYVLSAGHCNAVADEKGRIKVTTEDGKTISRKIVKEDVNSDLLILEGVPNMAGMPIASVQVMGDHIRTFTHGKGHDTYKTEGATIAYEQVQALDHVISSAMERAICAVSPKYSIFVQPTFFGDPQELCVLDVLAVSSTAMTVPGSSGGMAVNDSGELVGVVSMGDGVFSYFVPLESIVSFLSDK